jgi:hypothetical protein
LNVANLRDEIERLLCSWNTYEVSIDAPAVIDYDCRPSRDTADPIRGRVHAYRELDRLRGQAMAIGANDLARRTDCHLAYVGALLGERLPLDDFVKRTQGCETLGWSDEYVAWRGEQARKAVEALGISWGRDTWRDLLQSERNLTADEIPDALREAANKFEPIVRSVTGTQAPYDLTIETADVDAYWEYWLDGSGKDARLRLNMRNASFTDVQARQFALHEVLGHALQSASYSARCLTEDVPWVRILSVHAEHQVLLEGLAQALPLIVAPDDEPLLAHVRLDYYLQLVRAELHVAINNQTTISDCVRHGKARAPFWPDEGIGRLLADRSNDSLLRSYQWAYPAGADWFINLAETDDAETISAVHNAAYRDPLTPQQLMDLWPSGPPIGGFPGGISDD